MTSLNPHQVNQSLSIRLRFYSVCTQSSCTQVPPVRIRIYTLCTRPRKLEAKYEDPPSRKPRPPSPLSFHPSLCAFGFYYSPPPSRRIFPRISRPFMEDFRLVLKRKSRPRVRVHLCPDAWTRGVDEDAGTAEGPLCGSTPPAS